MRDETQRALRRVERGLWTRLLEVLDDGAAVGEPAPVRQFQLGHLRHAGLCCAASEIARVHFNEFVLQTLGAQAGVDLAGEIRQVESVQAHGDAPTLVAAVICGGCAHATNTLARRPIDDQ